MIKSDELTTCFENLRTMYLNNNLYVAALILCIPRPLFYFVVEYIDGSETNYHVKSSVNKLLYFWYVSYLFIHISQIQSWAVQTK